MQSLAQKYGVKGFPTIMLFAHDKQNPSLYEGARVAGAIESYALSQLELKVVAPEVLELAGQVSVKISSSWTLTSLIWCPKIVSFVLHMQLEI